MDIPDWIPLDAWNGFVEMRTKIKKPMTDYAIKLAVNKLAALKAQGHDPQDVLEQSIFNSWQGLFEVKSNGSHEGAMKFLKDRRK